MSSPAENFEALMCAARRVARYNWGTSVSENYHHQRMGAIDALRELVVEIDRQQPVPIAGTLPTDQKEEKRED